MNAAVVLRGGKWSDTATLATFQFQHMPYCIVQTVKQPTQFRYDKPEIWLKEDLLRLHAFGDGGDLTVRRDGDRYYWRFVGTEASAAGLAGEPFPHPVQIDPEQEQKALLYGVNKGGGQFQENIVGGANLNYPQALQNADRVMIHAHAVTAADGLEVVAYWTYKLDTYEPEPEDTNS